MMELNLEPKFLESLTHVPSESFLTLASVRSLWSQPPQTLAMLVAVANVC